MSIPPFSPRIPNVIQKLEFCQSQRSRLDLLEAAPIQRDTGDADAEKNQCLNHVRYKHHIDSFEIARESKRFAHTPPKSSAKIVARAPSHFEALPSQLLCNIFLFLSPRDQEGAACVCKKWKSILENKRFKEVRNFCFGKTKWLKYFGDIGVEPPLPPNIGKILKSNCIFWPEKRVRDTHLLGLVPEKVDGRPFHLNRLGELIKNPKRGYNTQYKYYSYYAKNSLGTKSLKSHWVLMTKDVIPESRNKPYEDQEALIQEYSERSKVCYGLPEALEIATTILMHYVKTGERLYMSGPQPTYARSREQVDNNELTVAIGGFFSRGLYIADFYWIHKWYGVAAIRHIRCN
jgi:hypothetical protein